MTQDCQPESAFIQVCPVQVVISCLASTEVSDVEGCHAGQQRGVVLCCGNSASAVRRHDAAYIAAETAYSPVRACSRREPLRIARPPSAFVPTAVNKCAYSL